MIGLEVHGLLGERVAQAVVIAVIERGLHLRMEHIPTLVAGIGAVKVQSLGEFGELFADVELHGQSVPAGFALIGLVVSDPCPLSVA